MGPLIRFRLKGRERLIILRLKELGRFAWLHEWEWGLIHEVSFCLSSLVGGRYRVGWGVDRWVRVCDGGWCGVL